MKVHLMSMEELSKAARNERNSYDLRMRCLEELDRREHQLNYPRRSRLSDNPIHNHIPGLT